MGSEKHVIEARRLRLISMGPEFLRASLSNDIEAAERLLGAELPPDWPTPRDVLERRLSQLETAPELEPWLTRALVSRSAERVVGVSGFHGPPGGDWLQEVAPRGVEFGYTVFRDYRGRGIAVEASIALMEWASDVHGVTQFVLSMSPLNAASARVAAKLGFARVGEWEHETRGLELVYRRIGPPDKAEREGGPLLLSDS